MHWALSMDMYKMLHGLHSAWMSFCLTLNLNILIVHIDDENLLLHDSCTQHLHLNNAKGNQSSTSLKQSEWVICSPQRGIRGIITSVGETFPVSNSNSVSRAQFVMPCYNVLIIINLLLGVLKLRLEPADVCASSPQYVSEIWNKFGWHSLDVLHRCNVFRLHRQCCLRKSELDRAILLTWGFEARIAGIFLLTWLLRYCSKASAIRRVTHRRAGIEARWRISL